MTEIPHRPSLQRAVESPFVGISLVLADDHTLVREGMRQILESEPDLSVLGEAATGDEALEVCLREQPDLALLDVRLPGRSGIRVAADLRDRGSPTRPLILSAFDDEEYVLAALDAGAAGYLVKTIPAADLVAMVRLAAGGETVLSPSLAAMLVRRHRQRSDERLSARELEVLRLVTEGLPNKVIGRRLGISERTVENHMRSVFDKLGVASRTEAVVLALRRHLVAGPDEVDWR
jgi:DNA-binding NarL/FixJ family response regulator